MNEIIVSFSGGKDSTVLLNIVRQVYPNTPAVFVDTGLEYPELRNFVKTVDNVVWLRPEMNFKEVIKTYGYPVISKEVAKRVVEYHRAEEKGRLEQSNAYKEFNGLLKRNDGKKSFYNKEKWKFLVDADFPISARCCDIMKKKPVKKYEKENGVFSIVGTMASESMSRKKTWKKSGCNAFDSPIPTSRPLSFWTEQDILKYIVRYNLDYASVYGEIKKDDNGMYYTTGENRTGCIFCMFGCHLDKTPNRFQRLKQTHPTYWNFCMKSWEEGGLDMKKVLDYIGVEYE